MAREHSTDILIVGGSVGGVAAALAATSRGKRVILTEEYAWLGGQLTSQAVPPDEHQWIEKGLGATRRYLAFREAVRQYYRDHYPLNDAARNNKTLNPGGGKVSRLCHEPRVAVAVIDGLLQWARTKGLLTVLTRRKPIGASTSGDRINAVTFKHLDGGDDETIAAKIVLDATELGDVLPLAKVEYVVGAESKNDTDEPHAIDGPAQPGTIQSFTWCFPVAFDPKPGANHVSDKPRDYERWRDYVPKLTPPWPDRLLSWRYSQPVSLKPIERALFEHEATKSRGYMWDYRKLVARKNYDEANTPHEVSLVNWPQNDYWEKSIIDVSPEDAATALDESKQLSLSFYHWLQTDAPRPDGGTGYPGLYLVPDLTGADDGLAMAPYIRESRRIKALFTITENHVGIDARKAAGLDPHSAEAFGDSVGTGFYRIDLHPSTGGNNYIDVGSLPFQIPLGALIPQRVENLLAACKNISTTHITNGCYRLHPVEWNIGESAGLLAALSLDLGKPPRFVREDASILQHFQDQLIAEGVPLEWPEEVRVRPE